jgi:hypothetical protein
MKSPNELESELNRNGMGTREKLYQNVLQFVTTSIAMVLLGEFGAWVSLRFFFVGAVGFNIGLGDCSDRRPGQGWSK